MYKLLTINKETNKDMQFKENQESKTLRLKTVMFYMWSKINKLLVWY